MEKYHASQQKSDQENSDHPQNDAAEPLPELLSSLFILSNPIRVLCNSLAESLAPLALDPIPSIPSETPEATTANFFPVSNEPKITITEKRIIIELSNIPYNADLSDKLKISLTQIFPDKKSSVIFTEEKKSNLANCAPLKI